MTGSGLFDLGGILKKVQEELESVGVAVDIAGDVAFGDEESGKAKVKVVCIAPGLHNSVKEMAAPVRSNLG